MTDSTTKTAEQVFDDPNCGCGHPATSHRVRAGNCSGDAGGGRYIVNPLGCENDCKRSCSQVRERAAGAGSRASGAPSEEQIARAAKALESCGASRPGYWKKVAEIALTNAGVGSPVADVPRADRDTALAAIERVRALAKDAVEQRRVRVEGNPRTTFADAIVDASDVLAALDDSPVAVQVDETKLAELQAAMQEELDLGGNAEGLIVTVREWLLEGTQ